MLEIGIDDLLDLHDLNRRRYKTDVLLSKFQTPIMALVLVLTGATVGYRFIENWSWLDSIWMVLITMTTIGYGEIHPLSPTGRLFTLAWVLLGVALGTYTVGQITRYIVEGELSSDLLSRKRRKTMRKLNDHFIVVGYGRLGREVTAELVHRGQAVAVIDKNEKNFELAHLHHLQPALEIVGDGSDDEILEQAAIKRAKAIAIATGMDTTNIFITLSARALKHKHTHSDSSR